MTQMANILIVGGNLSVCRAVAKMFESDGHHGICTSTNETAEADLDTFEPDLLVLNVTENDIEAVTTLLRRVRANQLTRVIPVVVLGQEEDHTLESRVMDAGA
jgi:PleD family two-component response regulator